MKLSEAGELALLEKVRKRFEDKPARLVSGIGDDCAVVRNGKSYTLLTTDMMVEGVHFDLRWTTPFQLGFKLVSVNVSDIYAMGGRPDFILLNFAAPGNTGMPAFNRLFEGIQKAAAMYEISLAGGDMSSSEKIVLSATVTGSATRVLYRKGARPGDRIYVTGNLGEAACGLRLLQKLGRTVEIERGQKADFPLEWKAVQPLITRHLMPRAVDPVKYTGSATSMMDISDGLLLDLSRLSRESKVGAVVHADRIPVSAELRRTAEYLGADPLDLALSGGEDYQLLFTAPGNRKVPGLCIGEVVSSGIKVVDEKGKVLRVRGNGYRHFTA